MPPVFHPHANLMGLFAVLGLLALFVAGALLWRSATAPPHAVGEPVPQPVPFSHKHHVSDDGIDCRYCHVSVESSAFAGMPSTETCMTCHSRLFTDAPLLRPLVESLAAGTPIRWSRVNRLPGFVYFNHGIHVKKGVGCVICHGRVDRMPITWRHAPLTMQWCLACHRDPASQLRPVDQVFNMEWQPPGEPEPRRQLGETLVEQHQVQLGRITDCSTCHR